MDSSRIQIRSKALAGLERQIQLLRLMTKRSTTPFLARRQWRVLQNLTSDRRRMQYLYLMSSLIDHDANVPRRSA